MCQDKLKLAQLFLKLLYVRGIMKQFVDFLKLKPL